MGLLPHFKLLAVWVVHMSLKHTYAHVLTTLQCTNTLNIHTSSTHACTHRHTRIHSPKNVCKLLCSTSVYVSLLKTLQKRMGSSYEDNNQQSFTAPQLAVCFLHNAILE